MNPEILAKLLQSGHKYRKELLAMLYVALDDKIKHMTPRFGIQGKETTGTGRSGAQLRPYRFAKDAKNTQGIDLRTIETYMGDVVEEFDPQELWSTVFANIVGKNPTEWEYVRQMAMLMVASVGENLSDSVFTAVRKADGDTTADLFDGFETILAKEKTDGKLSVAIGNMLELSPLSEVNVCDELIKGYLKGTHELLRKQKTKMFIPWDLYSDYVLGYRNDFGAAPYNDTFLKNFLEGTGGKCELVPTTGMTDTNIIVTPQKNMLVGMDQMGNKEKVEIRRPDNPKAVQFYMLAYFGVQFQSIDPRQLSVMSYTRA